MDIKDINRSIVKTYRKNIFSKVIKAIKDYNLIENGDNIAVCISGGKDSFLLSLILEEIRKYQNIDFKLKHIVMDPGYNKEAIDLIKENSKLFNLDVHIFKSNIFNDIKDEKNPCYICARKRRGHLYNKAKELGCNKIALGHHFDDVIETVLLNVFYAGSFGSMLPKLKSENYENMQLIRPLYLVKEYDIIKWTNYNNLKFINCACTLENKNFDSKRLEIKNLIKTLRKNNPSIDNNILKSTENVNLNTLLGYTKDKKHSFLDDY